MSQCGVCPEVVQISVRRAANAVYTPRSGSSDGRNGDSTPLAMPRATRQVKNCLNPDAVGSEHLANQLLLPIDLTDGSEFTTCTAGDHLHTKVVLIEQLLAVEILREATGWRIWVTPA